MLRPPTAAALLTALTLSGCGLNDPYASPPAPHTGPTAPVIVNNELTDPQGPTTAGTAPGAATPTRALYAFAQAYTNWTYKTLIDARRQLARASVDGARASQLRAAQEAAADTTLTAAKVRNHGTVVAISARLNGVGWVVITLESTVGIGSYQGLPAAYHVTLAQTRRTSPGRYAVSAWNPQT